MPTTQTSILREVAVAVAAALCCTACETTRSPTAGEVPVATRSLAASDDVIRDVPAMRVALPPQPRDFDTDDAALERAVQQAGGLAFVAFKSPTSPRLSATQGRRAAVPQAATQGALEVLRRAGVEVLDVFGASAMAYVRLPQGTAGPLRRNPAVDFVEPPPNRGSLEELAPSLQSVGAPARVVGSPASQYVPWNVAFVRAPEAWPYATGTLAKIMIIGTGLSSHPDLPAIPSGNCGGYYNACSSPFADGQALLGIIAAMDNSYGIIGVAPGLQAQRIYIWRAVRDDGTWDDYSYLAGVNNATLAGIKTVLVEGISGVYWEAEATVIASAWSAGTIVVAGVGSNGEQVTEMYPASLPDVIGASGVRDDSAFASAPVSGCTNGPGSNYGSMVDLAAPFWATTTFLGGYYDTKWIAHWCVSKLAAAHVAGIVALLQDRYPNYTAGQIVQRLTSTASRANYRDDYYGFGIPNAAAAMVEPPPPPPPPIFVSISGASSVRPYAYCRWYGSASGGTEPYAFTWYIDGVPVGDGSATLSYSNWANPFTITLSVTDANGRPGGNGLSVAIDPETWECLDQ